MDVLIISSSREEIDDYYKSVAKTISNYLAVNGYNLIYGGSSNSMMGICYNEFVKNNREVKAFTTPKYAEDLNNLPAAKHYLCETTFDLKKRLFENSDLIVCLPGGVGTLSELVSFIEEKRSNDKDIPMIVYDENRYYEKLFQIFADFSKDKFASGINENDLIIAHNKIDFTTAVEKNLNYAKNSMRR